MNTNKPNMPTAKMTDRVFNKRIFSIIKGIISKAGLFQNPDVTA
jgi:hypothetical protein